MQAKTRITMIDDEETLCHLVQLNLESTGRFEVTTATDPRDGIRLAQSERPDLIILDLMMPHMEGSVVAEKLLECQQTKNIPILFLTVLADKNISGAYMEGSHSRKMVAKPVTTAELVRRIDEMLANSGVNERRRLTASVN